MGFGSQLRLLLWKNFTLRKRQPVRVVIEIVWPLVLFVILVAVRFRPDVRKNIEECHYEPKAMPSAGTMTFLLSYICDFQNECKQNLSTDSINSFSDSQLVRFVDSLETLASNNGDLIVRLVQNIPLLEKFLETLVNVSDSAGSTTLKLSNVLTSVENVTEFLANHNVSLSDKAVETMLNASLDLLKVLSFVDDNNRTRLNDLVTVWSDLLRFNATNNTETSQEIAGIVCHDQILLEYFDFQNKTDAIYLQNQLCNLSLTDMSQLVEAVGSNLDRDKLVSEIRGIFLNVISVAASSNPDFLTAVTQMFVDFPQLSNVSGLLQDLPSFASAFTSSTLDSLNGSSWLSVLGSSLCGNNQTFFTLGGAGQNSQGSARETDNATRDYEEKKKDYESSGISSVCADVFASFQSTSATKILWTQLEPVILGVINYAPDTTASKSVIREANRTFDSIAQMFAVADSLQNLLPQVQTFLENNITAIRNFFGSPACMNTVNILKQQRLLSPFGNIVANVNESICERVSMFLGLNESPDSYTWQQALNNIYQVLSTATTYFKCFNVNKFVGHPNSSALVEASLRNIENNTFWSAIFFDGFHEHEVNLPNVIKYSIRMDTDKVDSTKRIMDKYWRPGNRGEVNYLKYWIFGFIYIQDMIDHAIIRLHTNTTQEPGVYTHQFPYGCYVYDRFTFAISSSLPLFMVVSWIYTVAMIIKGVVYEKEQRLKEVMKIMGLGNGVHWLAWFISAFVVMMITVILFVIIMKAGKVLEYSDPSVVFVFMLAFTVSTISQCFLISVFFGKANLAGVCGGFIYFVLYLPYTQLVQWEDDITTTDRILVSLSSNIAMGYGCSYLSQYEEQTVGAQWHNIGESPMVDDTFNLRTCIGMMFLDSIIYLLLTCYIEAVFPGQYGMPRKWYFFVQKSYWCGSSSGPRGSHRVDSDISIKDIRDLSEDFEKDPTDHKVGVAVRNLRKVYNRGDRVAIDGLTINFYESQITSFLGHNGAGKTTTMSILTGLFPPTSGTAYIYGSDIVSDIDDIRQGLGMCPQHNVLFDLLTVEEHIWFYARLKGSSEADVKAEMEQMIQDVGLPHKRKEKSQNLSGGMKRKLSVAIAFVGGSRTVILDEPTAGVDPYARRAIWELLLKFKKGRTIILSTHHMDEADVLGDRIAIISQGKLCTVGTSLFLKNRFGSGYYLTLVRSDVRYPDKASTKSSAVDSVYYSSHPSTATSVRTVLDVQATVGVDDEGFFDKNYPDFDDSSKSKIFPGFTLSRLSAFIEKYVPGATLVEDNSIEVCYRLPENDNHTEKYQKLFGALEKSYKDLGISSYGISDSSLEEVFLKVAQDSLAADGRDDSTGAHRNKEAVHNGSDHKQVSDVRSWARAQTSLLKLNYRSRVNSSERLTADVDDTESVMSDTLDCPQDVNFNGAGEIRVQGKKLLGHQLVALFLKRFHHVHRSKKGFISEIILPAAFVCLAMLFALLIPPFSEEPALELQPWMYEPTKGDSSLFTFFSNDKASHPMSLALEASLLQVPYYGCRCMNSSLYTISGKSCETATNNSYWTSAPLLTGNISIDSPACSCESGYQQCPDRAGGPEPSVLKIGTHDHLYNTTGRNLSDWLVKTVAKYQKRRYGGFSIGEENSLGHLKTTQISSVVSGILSATSNNSSLSAAAQQLWQDLQASLKFSITDYTVKVWFNNKGWASSVSYMNALNNAILRSLLPPDEGPNYGIVTFNHPMNLTKKQLGEETL